MKVSSASYIGLSIAFFFGFLFLLIYAPPSWAEELSPENPAAASRGPERPPFSAGDFQDEVKGYLGVPYKRGGSSTKGFDCSGFVKLIYHKIFGIDLPHQSAQQARSPVLTEVSLDALKAGDLLFFSSGPGKRRVTHVGIYLSDNVFIHSAVTKGVVTSRLRHPSWKSRIVSAKRVNGIDAWNEGEKAETTFDLAMALDEQSAVILRHVVTVPLSFQGPLFRYGLTDDTPSDLSHRLELGYDRALGDQSWIFQIRAFQDQLLRLSHEGIYAYRGLGGQPELSETGLFLPAYARGLSIASDIRPAESVRLRPSLTFFDYGPAVKRDALPRLALGLDLELFSSSEGWSLSTALQYPLSRYAAAWGRDPSNSRDIDLSLTFYQRLTDQVHFSMTGKNLSIASDWKGSGSAAGAEDRQFSLMLHFFNWGDLFQ
ncbi:MAG: C40 family peptidase [Pseudomonadota bacterium]